MKRLLALLLALLTLFAVGCEKGSDPNTPQVTGDTVVKDGIPQNSLCYINASFEEGLLHFTYVNETDVYADTDEHMESPRAERWSEDGWVVVEANHCAELGAQADFGCGWMRLFEAIL